MTVRLTPIESDSTPTAPVPAPPHLPDVPVTSPASAPGAPTSGGTPPDSRIAVREARRTRRRTAWLCAAVVAAALALTIVVVILARDRPLPAASAATVTLSAPSATPHGSTALPLGPSPGAAAPEGGNP